MKRRGATKYKAPEIPHEMEKSLHNLCSINHFQKFGAGENDGKEFEIVFGDIFCPFPTTFGSRGDRYLWGKLASYFSMEKIYAEFNAELALERAFEHLLEPDPKLR